MAESISGGALPSMLTMSRMDMPDLPLGWDEVGLAVAPADMDSAMKARLNFKGTR